MVDHAEPRWRIGQVSARTGLTARTLRYYEELGLLKPSERLVSGHRVYASDDLRRLYRISLLRQLGLPLSDIAREITDSPGELNETITRHVGQVDQRLAALGRHRERMITVRESLSNGSPSDEELLDLMDELAQVDHGLAQRLTLRSTATSKLYMITSLPSSALGRARSPAMGLAGSYTASYTSGTVWFGCIHHQLSTTSPPQPLSGPVPIAWPSWSMMLIAIMRER
jgi:DNA-binding transcriptional MerR regulator